MPTFKAIIKPDQERQDGTYNIKIRVTHNRKIGYISTQWYIEKSGLRPNYEIKAQLYKDLVEDKIREYRKICDEIKDIEKMPLSNLVDILKNKRQASCFKLDIIKCLMDDYHRLLEISQKRGKKGFTTAESRKYAANSLKKFTGREIVDVNELTTRFVEEYIAHMRGDNLKLTRKCVVYPCVINKVLKELKSKYNDEESGIINIIVDPFEKIKQKRINTPKKQLYETSTQKMSLTVDVMQKIIDLQDFDSHREMFARDMFLLSFLLIGTNSIDLYTCTKYDSKEQVLTYNRQKVEDRRDDDGLIKIKVVPQALPLIAKYKNRNSARKEVFNFYAHYADHRNFNKSINLGLKRIAEKIGMNKTDFSYYSARRSWATLARNVAKIDKYTVNEALNHVDREMKVTDIYIDKDFSNIWEANSKVVALLEWDNFNINVKIKKKQKD